MRYFRKLAGLYDQRIRNKREEPRFLILVFFFLTFISSRIVVYSIKYHFFPYPYFRYLHYDNLHIHHLVYGIILLLLAGLIGIPQFGKTLVRFSSILYGIGAALTLDEFALWIRLDPKAYFGPAGRISIDAVVFFLLILLSSLWYGIFWQKVAEHTVVYFFFRNQKKRFTKIFSKTYQVINRNLLLVIFLGFLALVFLAINKHFQLPQIREASGNAHLSKNITLAKISRPAQVQTTALATAGAKPKASVIQSVPNNFCLQVPVLMYHHVQPQSLASKNQQTALSVDSGIFTQQMAYLVAHGYTAITAEQLVTALRDHTFLPIKSVVLTFDDGYLDIFTYAYPVLQKYHLIGNLFIPTGLLGRVLGTNTYLTWNELETMVNSNSIFAYDHTLSHFGLAGGSVSKDQNEILTAKQQLEQHLGKPNLIFAYPYSSGATIPWVTSLLRQDGFLGAFSTLPGTYQCNSFIMSLHRTRIGNASLASYGIF